MKKHLIIIGLLGNLLACTGQPGGGDADIRSAQKYPYRFHTYTPHIYVDAFLNDSLPVRLVYDCAAPFVWLDSTFVDNHYGYESKQTMAFKDVIGYFGFGLLQRMGEVVIDFPNQVVYFRPRISE